MRHRRRFVQHRPRNLLFLRHYLNAYPEGDDRPPQELTHFQTLTTGPVPVDS